MKNYQQLIAIMDRYDVSISEVAELLGFSENTVRIYRSKSGNQITSRDLELLEFKLRERLGM